MNANKKVILDLVYNTFRRMDRICESTREWDVYFDACILEEREHRKHAPEGEKFGISVRDTAQLFAVRNVFASLVKIGFQPEAKDYFSIKKTCFMGVAIADIKKADLIKEFSVSEMGEFYKNVDYVELIKA